MIHREYHMGEHRVHGAEYIEYHMRQAESAWRILWEYGSEHGLLGSGLPVRLLSELVQGIKVFDLDHKCFVEVEVLASRVPHPTTMFISPVMPGNGCVA